MQDKEIRTSDRSTIGEEMSAIKQKMSALTGKSDRIVIAIGASTGGTDAIAEVLKKLPENTPGIVIVQHMPQGFTKMYAERLDKLCRIEVKEAEHGDRIRSGQALLAPGGLQMRVIKDRDGGYCVSCLEGEKISGHKPSVDALFFSVAENVGKNAIGIILTGMGRDGADGLLKMRKCGAFTIGQDEHSSVVYGMPMAANSIGAVTIQASEKEIPQILVKHLAGRE